MRKIAFIVDYYPYMGGYSSRVAEQLRTLSSRYEVHLIYIFRKPENECIDVSKLVKEHRVGLGAERKGSAELSKSPLLALASPSRLANALRNTIFWGSPVYYSPYVSERIRAEVKKIIEEERADVVWANGVIGSLMAGRERAKMRILDMCDSRYLLYLSLRRIERSPLRKAMLWADGVLARRFERGSARQNDIVVYICRRDGLAAGLKEDAFFVLPNIRTGSAVPKSAKRTDMIMLGRWDYLPNLDALNFAVREVLPKLRRALTMEVVGLVNEKDRSALEWASRGASNSKLLMAGVVDDIFAHLAASRLMLAPTRAGAGVQNKILDAAEAGLPVVTTKFSKSAIDPDGECDGIIACMTPDEFAGAIERLLADPKEAQRLGAACRSFYDAYSAASRKKHEELMGRIDARVGS